MGRYKLGPQGAYFDPNDSGPDQASPDQIQQFQQTQQPVQPNTGYQPPTGGINPGGGNIRPVPLPPGTQLPPMPQIPGGNQGPIARGGWGGQGNDTPGFDPDPEMTQFMQERGMRGMSFEQALQEWRATHPGSMVGATILEALHGTGISPLIRPQSSFGGSPYKPPTGGINPWGAMGGLQMLGPKALL